MLFRPQLVAVALSMCNLSPSNVEGIMNKHASSKKTNRIRGWSSNIRHVTSTNEGARALKGSTDDPELETTNCNSETLSSDIDGHHINVVAGTTCTIDGATISGGGSITLEDGASLILTNGATISDNGGIIVENHTTGNGSIEISSDSVVSGCIDISNSIFNTISVYGTLTCGATIVDSTLNDHATFDIDTNPIGDVTVNNVIGQNILIYSKGDEMGDIKVDNFTTSGNYAVSIVDGNVNDDNASAAIKSGSISLSNIASTANSVSFETKISTTGSITIHDVTVLEDSSSTLIVQVEGGADVTMENIVLGLNIQVLLTEAGDVDLRNFQAGYHIVVGQGIASSLTCEEFTAGANFLLSDLITEGGHIKLKDIAQDSSDFSYKFMNVLWKA